MDYLTKQMQEYLGLGSDQLCVHYTRLFFSYKRAALAASCGSSMEGFD